MSLAAIGPARTKRTARTTRTGNAERRIISLPLPAQLVGELVLIVGAARDSVPFQQLAAGPDGVDEPGAGPAAPDLRGQPAGDLFPLPLLHLLVDTRVGEQHHAPLEEGEKEEDACAVAGAKDLLLEERGGRAQAGSRLEHRLPRHPAPHRRQPGREEVAHSAADRRRQYHPVGQRDAPDAAPLIQRESDARRQQRSQGRSLPGRRGILVAPLDDVGHDLPRSPRLGLLHGGLDRVEVGLGEEAVGGHGVDRSYNSDATTLSPRPALPRWATETSLL